MSSKERIKKVIISEIRKLDPEKFESSSDQELESLIFRNSKTIRLKKTGWNILRKHFNCEKFELGRRLTGKELISIQEKLEWPYFLSAKNIYLFNSKDIFKLRLYGGDIGKWLA